LFSWDGKELKQQWGIDFYKEKLGRAHHMKFTAKSAQSIALGSPLSSQSNAQVVKLGTAR